MKIFPLSLRGSCLAYREGHEPRYDGGKLQSLT